MTSPPRTAPPRCLPPADVGEDTPAPHRTHPRTGSTLQTPRILLVDDDPAIRDAVTRTLRREGFTVDAVATGADGLQSLASGPHLVILDLGLPDTDGLDVCRQLRQDGHTVPVLILSARASDVDIVVGIDAGADDYVTKPFRTSHLINRVRALLPQASHL